MNKLALVLVGLIVFGGIAAYAFNRSSQEPQLSTNSPSNQSTTDAMSKDKMANDAMESDQTPDSQTIDDQPDSTMTNDTQMMAESAGYQPYTPEALAAASDNRRVLFFYANWCPTCRPVDAELEASSDQIPDDVSIFRVNYNDPNTDQDEKDLANQYGITYQHTFVQIDSDGQEVAKWNGGQLDELLANIK